MRLYSIGISGWVIGESVENFPKELTSDCVKEEHGRVLGFTYLFKFSRKIAALRVESLEGFKLFFDELDLILFSNDVDGLNSILFK